MMNSILSALQPKRVFEIFETICSIPHGSYHCEAIADYCQHFAQEVGCFVERDPSNNLIITITASEGYEDAPAVILQGHLDMVCAKTTECTHDFLTDPLRLQIHEDFVSATDTTLGGDDGIAVAMILALAEDKTIPHGKLYGVLTADEEVGMTGAQAMDCTPISDAAYMINIDSEEEGILYAGCAGGAIFTATYPLHFVKARGLMTTLRVSGLDGGHSGAEIHRYGNNAAVLLAEILLRLNETFNISIINLNSGKQDNVIPAYGEAQILIGPNQQEAFEKMLEEMTAEYRHIRPGVDMGLTITASYTKDKEALVLGRDSEQLALFAITNMPNGVITAGLSTPGVVDTSCNLGITYIKDQQLVLSSLIRSNQVSARGRLINRMTDFTIYLGGTCTVSGVYPPWEYHPQSSLQTLMSKTWHELFNKVPVITTMHAGLECGFFAEQLPHVDIVSIGPDILDIHTPKERLSISSLQRIWMFLCRILEQIKG